MISLRFVDVMLLLLAWGVKEASFITLPSMGPFLKCFEEKGIWLHDEWISLWSINLLFFTQVGATVPLEGLPLLD